MSGEREDWHAVLDALRQGDRVAAVKVTRVVTGFLARYRAYDLRDSWEDVAQDVMVAVLKALRAGTLRDANALVSFVGTITRNKLADLVTSKRKPGYADPVGDPEAADGSERALERAAPRADPDLLIDLRRALPELPEKERLVLGAIYLEGRSYEETSTHLGMPEGTVKRHQTQGLRRLREIMGVTSRRERSDFPAVETHS